MDKEELKAKEEEVYILKIELTQNRKRD